MKQNITTQPGLRPQRAIRVLAILAAFASAAADASRFLAFTPDPARAGAVSPEGCRTEPGLARGLLTASATTTDCHTGSWGSDADGHSLIVGSKPTETWGTFETDEHTGALAVGGHATLVVYHYVAPGTGGPGGEVVSELQYRVRAKHPVGTSTNLVWGTVPVPPGGGRTQVSFEVPEYTVPAGSRLQVLLTSDEAPEGRLFFGDRSLLDEDPGTGTMYYSSYADAGITLGNLPPVADAGADFAIDEGQTAMLNGADSSDPDDQLLGYAWTQVAGPAVVLSAGNSDTPSFTAPLVCTATDMVFSLTVTDPTGLTSTDKVTVTVQNLNATPVADAGADFAVDEGGSATLNANGSTDADHCQALSYGWTQTGGPTVALNNADTATPGFTAPDVAADTSLTFRLTVSDPGGLASADTVNVVVRDVSSQDGTPPTEEPPPPTELPPSTEGPPTGEPATLGSTRPSGGALAPWLLLWLLAGRVARSWRRDCDVSRRDP